MNGNKISLTEVVIWFSSTLSKTFDNTSRMLIGLYFFLLVTSESLCVGVMSASFRFPGNVVFRME